MNVAQFKKHECCTRIVDYYEVKIAKALPKLQPYTLNLNANKIPISKRFLFFVQTIIL